MVACLLVAAGCTTEPTAPATGTPTVNSTSTSTQDGFDVADLKLLQSTWWTWAASAPEAENPVIDTTGEYCARAQPKAVWLLAGSFGEKLSRRCTVPAGVPLAGPAVNRVGDTQADCDDFMRDAAGKVTLDGATLPLRKADGMPITFTAVVGNPVTSERGEFDGFGCGLWFSLDDLAEGDHDLVIEGSGTGFSLSVTYALTVSSRT
jgi:hypothetical protein